MKTDTITLGGAEYKIAPLKSLQVAEFFDEKAESRVEITTKTIKNITRALRNADPTCLLVKGLTEEDAIAAVNDAADTWLEVEEAFGAVLDISAMRKKTEGEATAAGSISSESSVASSPLPAGPSAE